MFGPVSCCACLVSGGGFGVSTFEIDVLIGGDGSLDDDDEVVFSVISLSLFKLFNLACATASLMFLFNVMTDSLFALNEGLKITFNSSWIVDMTHDEVPIYIIFIPNFAANSYANSAGIKKYLLN